MIRRSIRTPILAAFVISVASASAALGYSLIQLRSIGRNLRALDQGYLPLAEVNAELEAVARQVQQEDERLLKADPSRAPSLRTASAFHSTSMSNALQRGMQRLSTAGQADFPAEEVLALELAALMLADVDTARKEADSATEAYLDRLAASTTPETLPSATQTLLQRRQVVDRIARLANFTKSRISGLSARTTRAQTRALTVGGALASLAMLLSGLLAVAAVGALRPIALLTEQVQEQVRRLARSDGRFQVDNRDGAWPGGEALGEGVGEASGEVGVLAREFAAMAAAVAERDRRLTERAEALDRISLRLRRVLDTIQAGIIVVERGSVAMLNPAARRLWDLAEGARLPEDLLALAPGRSLGLRAGDREVDVEVVPFGPRGLLLVGEDVTDRNQDREKLARSQRLALVGQMLAQITHEVRNPLNAISLHVELLADAADATEEAELIATITAEIRRLEAVTGRYLELSRGRRPEFAPASPLHLLRELLRVEEEGLRRQGVALVLEADGPSPSNSTIIAGSDVVELDAEVLRRAVRNLIRNAAEAGAHRVTLTLSQNEGELRVLVADDGPGLPPEAAAQAFDPFFTTKAQGTGLGLAIARQELEDVGGQIELIEGHPGGAAFAIHLPVRALQR